MSTARALAALGKAVLKLLSPDPHAHTPEQVDGP